jgi:hypothetical protein
MTDVLLVSMPFGPLFCPSRASLPKRSARRTASLSRANFTLAG